MDTNPPAGRIHPLDKLSMGPRDGLGCQGQWRPALPTQLGAGYYPVCWDLWDPAGTALCSDAGMGFHQMSTPGHKPQVKTSTVETQQGTASEGPREARRSRCEDWLRVGGMPRGGLGGGQGTSVRSWGWGRWKATRRVWWPSPMEGRAQGTGHDTAISCQGVG